MISIIVSSYKEDIFLHFSENVLNTIGVPFEIVKIDNPGIMSIAKAYNLGRSQSKYEILVYCHEDILFHTKNWGNVLIETFHSPNVGLLGVAGNKCYGNMPVGWFDYDYSSRIFSIIQHNNDKVEYITQGFDDENTKQVLVLDGVFLASHIQHNLTFNENVLGFHAYDLSISIESLMMKLENRVTNQILIEHFSNGKLDSSWYISMDDFYMQYYSMLKGIKTVIKHDNIQAYKKFIVGMYSINKRKAIRYWFRFMKFSFFDRFNIWFFFKLFT